MIEKELQGSARPEEAPELPSLAETAIEEDCGNDAATPVSPTKGLLLSSAGFLVGIFHKLTGSAVERDQCDRSEAVEVVHPLTTRYRRHADYMFIVLPEKAEKGG